MATAELDKESAPSHACPFLLALQCSGHCLKAPSVRQGAGLGGTSELALHY